MKFWEPEVGAWEMANVERVLASNYLNDGEVTEEFEDELCHVLGLPYCVAVTSGTAALYLALKALGIGPGDDVIVPDITFIATANAVTMTGARVVLADVDWKLLLDVDHIKAVLTPRTRAIIPVHVSGRNAHIQEICRFANENDIYVVEDAAEALGSRHLGDQLGKFGDVGCFSLSPQKMITTGQGGFITAKDRTLYERLKELKDQGRLNRGTGGEDIHPVVGFNFKFTNVQAAIGLGQLEMLWDRSKKLVQIYQRYEKGLSNLPGVVPHLFHTQIGERPQWVDAYCAERDKLVDYLAERDIHCRKFWHPLHTQKPYFMPDALFPNSTKFAPKSLWLPSSFKLTMEDVDKVCEEIRKFYG